MYKTIAIIIVFILITLTSFSQSLEREANTNFEDENYRVALKQYLKLLRADKKNEEFHYRIGVCYLKVNMDKTRAIPHLNFADSLGYYVDDIKFYLAQAYFHKYKFDKAVELFKEYKEYIRETINTEQIKELNRDIEICYNAKKLMETPVDVTFYNMGTNINSRRADYNPHIAADGHIMVFASNKKYIKDYQQYVKNCYMSFPVKDDFGEWSKARSFGSKVNTEENEDVVALSHDGTKAIVHLDNFVAGDDIGVSTKRTTRFREVIVFNKEINSKYLEEGACFSPSMDTLFFASDRPEGLGGFDIYYCTRISKEEWTMPVNMGISINTKYDENFPEMSHDGTKLRLASKGYNTMGGYDIFECEWIKEEYKWGKPKNMGYPVNDTYDNTNISITKNGRYGYMPKWRKEGVGGLDIYKVIFNDVPATKIKYHGIIAIGDSIYPKQIADISSDIRMKIFDKRTKDEIADLTEMAKQAKYEIELVPGTYVLVIKGNAYETYQMDIIIYEEQAIITDYKIDIYLTEKINNQ